MYQQRMSVYGRLRALMGTFIACFILGGSLWLVLGVAGQAEAAVSCSDPVMVVTDETDLNTAIGCYNSASSGVYLVSLFADITLTADTTEINHSGTGTLSIFGNGMAVDGDNGYRPLAISAGAVVISDTVLSNGYNGSFGGALFMSGGAAGLINSTVMSSTAGSCGGGIGVTSGASIVISDSVIQENNQNGVGLISGGGGICSYYGAVGLSNTAVLSNSAVNGAGVLAAYSAVGVDGGTIRGNMATANGGWTL